MVKFSLQIVKNSKYPSIICNYDNQKYIFNVPETFQRFFREHKVKMSPGPVFFFTRPTTEYLSGIFGLMLTLYHEQCSMNSRLYGDKRISHLMQMLRTNEICGYKTLPYSCSDFQKKEFVLGIRNYELIEKMFDKSNGCDYGEQLQKVKKIKISKEIAVDQQNDATQYITKDGHYSDQYLDIIPIHLIINEQMQEESIDVRQTISYIILTKKMKGSINNQKIQEYQIPKKMMGQLMKEGSLVLENGVEVKVEDIRDPDIPPQAIFILDIHNEDQLQQLKQNLIFKDFLQQNSKDIQCFVHLASPQTILQPYYQNFIQGLHDIQHLLASIDGVTNKVEHQEFQLRSFQLNQIFNQYFPNNFVKLQQEKCYFPSNLQNVQGQIPLFIKSIFPIKKQNYEPIQNLDFNQINEKFPVKDVVKNWKNNLNQSEYKSQQRLTFLGTGSMIPGKYRNVSGILIQDEILDSYVVLDCGEGTWFQLLSRNMDISNKNVLIWISHIHSDHHLGLLSFLNEYTKQSQKSLTLIIPSSMLVWIYYYQKIQGEFNMKTILIQSFTGQDIEKIAYMDFLSQKIDEQLPFAIKENQFKELIIECQDNYNNFVNGQIQDKFGIKNLEMAPVDHCPQAYGICINFLNGKRLSYSGDTRPCQRFQKISENVDLMIHESTFTDELQDKAIQNMHSTQREAVELAIEAKVKNLVLSHFSQRYAKSVPKNPQKQQGKIGQGQNINLEQSEYQKEIKFMPGYRLDDKIYEDYLANRTVHAFDHLSGLLDEYQDLHKVSQLCSECLPDDD